MLSNRIRNLVRMKMMMTKKLRVWFRVFDSVVILSMLLQPVAPAVIFSQEISSGDGAAVVTEASASAEADAPKAEEKTAPVETKTEEVAAPVVEPVVVPAEEPKAEEPAAVVEPSTETAPVVSEPVQTVEPTETPVVEAVTPEVPAVPTVEAEGEASTEREPAAPEWKQNEDGSRTITVSEGETYSYPDSGLKIQFTRIDADKNADNAREITVKEVKLSDAQVADLGAVSESAWDITSTMENGSFEYSLTLPTKDGVDADRVEVAYAEEVEDISDIEKTGIVDAKDMSIDGEDDEVSIKGLDHFTFFLVRQHDRLDIAVDRDEYEGGETVRAEADGLDRGKRYMMGFRDAEGALATVSDCRKAEGDGMTFDYALPNDAGAGTWSAFIDEYASRDRECDGDVMESAETHFAVLSRPEPAENPVIEEACGIDIALVVDNSNSIDRRQMERMKEAVSGFVDSLAGTKTRFSVVRFGSSAQVLKGFTGDAEEVKHAIDGIHTGGGATDWAEAFQVARGTFDPRPEKPDMILFASDGDPTAPYGRGDVTDRGDIYDAITAANAAKEDGIRILALGIGRNPSIQNLQAVSGPTVDADDLSESDVVTTDFDGLSDALSRIAKTSCGSTITVNKFIGDMDHPAGEGFSFVVGRSIVSTDAYGVAGPVKVSDRGGKTDRDRGCEGKRGHCDAPRTVDVTEIGMPEGFTFDSAVCRDQHGREKGVATENGVRDIEVRDEEIISCDVINHQQSASIKGRVFIDADGDGVREAGERFEKHWTIGLYADNGDRWFDPATDELIRTSVTGDCDGNRYCFEGIAPGRYYAVENLWDGYVQTRPALVRGRDFYRVRIEDGQTKYFQFGNFKEGSISGMKWEDADQDAVKDEDESGVSGWNIDLCTYGESPEAFEVRSQDDFSVNVEEEDGGLEGDGEARPAEDNECVAVASTVTDEDGNYSFGSLVPGRYRVTEESREGWTNATPTLVDVSVSGDPNDDANAVTGVDFGNYRSVGTLSIEKENDASTPKMPGETVRYTLRIAAGEGRVTGVTVNDLPPEIATYVDGSWSAESSLGSAHVGNLKLDHIYASPGIWDLGELQDGEVITLSYDATVNAGTDAGEYPDLAFARGLGQGGNLLAVAGDAGNIGSDRYVGTGITVADTTEPASVKAKADIEEEVEVKVKSRVLGATLPETGSAAYWVLLVSALLGMGALAVGAGLALRSDRGRKLLTRIGRGTAVAMLATVLCGSFAQRAWAVTDSDILIRMEKPKAAANGGFVIDFVVLDTAATADISAQCQVQKPGASDFLTFSTIEIQKGGDSGQCSVGSGELSDQGAYVFRVKADGTTGAEYTVEYDATMPGRPKYIEKDEKNDCLNEVTFRTAADGGQTVRVELYRADDDSYIADATTRIADISIGSDVKYVYTDALSGGNCDRDFRYSVRAFDEAGNVSPIRTEEVTETEKVTRYEDVAAGVTGSVTLTPGVASEAGSALEGTGNGSEETEVIGEVAGQETGVEGVVEGAETAQGGSKIWIWVIIAGAAAYGAYRWYIARKMGTPEVK